MTLVFVANSEIEIQSWPPIDLFQW